MKKDKAPYGYCPICGKAGIATERSINGDSLCPNRHRYQQSSVRPYEIIRHEDDLTIANLKVRNNQLLVAMVQMREELMFCDTIDPRVWRLFCNTITGESNR